MNIIKIALSLVFTALIAFIGLVCYDTFGPKHSARVAISMTTEPVIESLRHDPDDLAVAMIRCNSTANGPVRCLSGIDGKGVITISYLAGDNLNRKVFGSRRVWVDEKTQKVAWSYIKF
jgi:hypothetical protein